MPFSHARGGLAAQDGILTRIAVAACPAVTSIRVAASSGMPVTCRSVIPASAQVTSEGMNRLTYRPRESRE